MNLLEYKELIENNPIHIATINKDNTPNISVASDVKVLDKEKLIISCNEMNNTQENIKFNKNIALTSFNSEWIGLRLFGTADFYTDGEYYDFCKNTFLPITK